MFFLSKRVLEKLVSTFLISFIIVSWAGVYFLGLFKGYKIAKLESAPVSPSPTVTITSSPTPTPVLLPTIIKEKASWGGPELWEEVNKKRLQYGVNPLIQRDELCTIASIRLNELLELGKLDGHVGFSNMKERRPDLAWIFEKYSTIAEFLAVGGETAEETISLWENTLAHKKLLTAGEYVWGCIYAQNTFAVAIVAF